jgi:hypothetical protein
MNLNYFGPHRLIYLQLRAAWDLPSQTCTILNSEEIKPTLIVTVITDIILLVTMLVGLSPLITDSSCAFGLGRLLWKQVGSACSPFAVPSSH